ncbi:MAG: hypothetical protein HKO64_04505 [Xanthomonadales bacterium]|nr:hypothetical protein [Gammaproteobacteria bacterium]NNL94860.1 hypothetical protein [Xanthomonadales bacterium]
MTDQKSPKPAQKKAYIPPKIESVEELESVAAACVATDPMFPPKETAQTPGCSSQNIQS